LVERKGVEGKYICRSKKRKRKLPGQKRKRAWGILARGGGGGPETTAAAWSPEFGHKGFLRGTKNTLGTGTGRKDFGRKKVETLEVPWEKLGGNGKAFF